MVDLNTWKFDYQYPIISIALDRTKECYIVFYDDCYDKRDGTSQYGYYCCYPERSKENIEHSVEVTVFIDSDRDNVLKEWGHCGYYDYRYHEWYVGSAEKGYIRVQNITRWSY